MNLGLWVYPILFTSSNESRVLSLTRKSHPLFPLPERKLEGEGGTVKSLGEISFTPKILLVFYSDLIIILCIRECLSCMYLTSSIVDLSTSSHETRAP